MLLHDHVLGDTELLAAITANFARRQTALPAEIPVGLIDAFAADRMTQTQWQAFLRKNRPERMIWARCPATYKNGCCIAGLQKRRGLAD